MIVKLAQLNNRSISHENIVYGIYSAQKRDRWGSEKPDTLLTCFAFSQQNMRVERRRGSRQRWSQSSLSTAWIVIKEAIYEASSLSAYQPTRGWKRLCLHRSPQGWTSGAEGGSATRPQTPHKGNCEDGSQPTVPLLTSQSRYSMKILMVPRWAAGGFSGFRGLTYNSKNICKFKKLCISSWYSIFDFLCNTIDHSLRFWKFPVTITLLNCI